MRILNQAKGGNKGQKYRLSSLRFRFENGYFLPKSVGVGFINDIRVDRVFKLKEVDHLISTINN